MSINVAVPKHDSSPPLQLDLKLQLQATDYGNFLQNEPSPIPVTLIDDKLKMQLVIEFRHMRAHAVAPLTTFMDFIT